MTYKDSIPTSDEIDESLRYVPFHRWLGLRVGKLTEEGLEIIMPWRSEIISITEPHPVVHGGILASLIDLTGLYAVLSKGGQPAGTAYMNIDYHRQATEGPLTARAKVLKIGRVISTAEIYIYDPENRLLASGRGGYPRLTV